MARRVLVCYKVWVLLGQLVLLFKFFFNFGKKIIPMVYYRLLRFERSTCFYEPSVFSANDQHGSSSPLIILRMELQIFVNLILLGLLMFQLPSRFMGTMLKSFRIAHLRMINSQNLVIVKRCFKLFGREDIFGISSL